MGVVETDRDRGVLTITLADEANRNALGGQLVVTDLMAASPAAFAAAEQLLVRVPTLPVEEAFVWTGELSGQLFASEEARAGMTVYLEKRPAPWAVAR